MKQLYSFCIFTLFLLGSCSVLKKGHSDTKTLFSVAGEPTKTEEFVYVFNKNRNLRQNLNSSESEVADYLDSYINFKLKVKDARALGLHENPQYIQELSTYKKQLSEPFLINNTEKEKIAKEVYEHFKEEVNAAHILIKIEGKDSLVSYNEIFDLRNRALKGEDFGRLAFEHSHDPSAKVNKGDLGYFSAMRMVYPFEKHAYATAKGEISPIFKTRFGYHILKIKDKRQVGVDYKVAHIFLQSRTNSSESVKAISHEKIHRIYDFLREGEAWDGLCESFSEDRFTRLNGGVIRDFTQNPQTKSLIEYVSSLKNIGDISEPVKNEQGWHILKLVDRKEKVQDYESLRSQLINYASNALRSDLAKNDVKSKLSSKLHFSENTKTLKSLASILELDTIPKAQKTIFQLLDSTYLTHDFVEEYKDAGSKEKISDYYDDYLYENLLEAEERNLAKHNKEYAMLLDEYTDGLLLFSVMESKIWQKATTDSVGLKSFFDKHITKYQKPREAKLFLFSTKDSTVLNEIKKDLSKMSAEDQLNENKIQKYLKRYPTASVSFENTIYKKGGERFSEKIPFEIGHFFYKKNNRHYLAQVYNILEKEPVVFSNIKGSVIVDFQNQLEGNWIKELKQKYAVKINRKELQKLKKRFEL